MYILVHFLVNSEAVLGWLDSDLPKVRWIRVVATFLDCVCPLPVAWMHGLSGSLSQRDLQGYCWGQGLAPRMGCVAVDHHLYKCALG
ncbi:hypothetical protein WJX82_004682 [Trebouxia sp. C0006]